MPARFPRLLPLLLIGALALGLVGCDSGGSDDGKNQVATTVAFTQSSVSATEDDSTATLGVQISNPPADERVTVEVLFAEDASAPVNSDSLDGYQTQTVTFPAGAEDGAVREVPLRFDLNLEPGQGLEAYFALQQVTGPARIGEPREVALRIGKNVIPIAEGRAKSTGTVVTVEGTVTRISGDNIFIQDDSGGIVVFAPGSDAEGEFADAVVNGDVAIGDRVQVTGPIDEFGGLREVTDVGTEFAVLSRENDLPEPTSLTVKELLDAGEQYEGTLVRIEELTTDAGGTFTAGGADGNYTVTGPEGSTITLRIPGDSYYGGQPIPTDAFTFEGVLSEFFSGYQLFAVEKGDLIYESGGGGGNTAPTAGFDATTDGLTASFDASASTDPDGSIASYEWAFGDDATGTGQTTEHTYDAAGDYDVTLTVTDDAGATSTATQTVTVGGGGTNVMDIIDARGVADDENVTVEGTITRTTGSNTYLQDESGPTGASGLVVFQFGSDASGEFADAIADGSLGVGDRVQVSGAKSTYNGVVEIAPASYERLSDGDEGSLPDAQSISLADVGEDYESELVTVDGLSFQTDETTFATDGGDGFGNYTVTDGDGNTGIVRIPSGSFYVDEPIPTGTFTFTGPVGQRNDTYKLVAIREGDLAEGGGGGAQTLLSEDFQDGLGAFTAVSVTSSAVWDTSTAGSPPSAPYASVSGFNADEDSNDWLISPALNFADATDEKLAFTTAKGYDGPELNVLVSTNYDGDGSPEDADWTDITDRATLAQNSDKQGTSPFTPFISSGEVDLSDDAFQDETVYVAFQYTSTPDNAATWEVDDVVIAEGSATDNDGFPEPPGRPSN